MSLSRIGPGVNPMMPTMLLHCVPNRRAAFRVFLVILLPALAWAQPSPSPVKPNPPTVASVEITGQSLFSVEYDLLPLVQTEENRKLFGIEKVTPWLWIYRWGERSRLPRKLREAIRKSGEPPAYLDSLVAVRDADRLKLYFRQQGYRNANVTFKVRKLNQDSSRVRVSFTIQQGKPTYVRRFIYSGLDRLDPDQIQALMGNAVIRSNQPLTAGFGFRAKPEQRFIEPQLYEERRRVISYLQDQGYSEITRDSVKILVTPFRADSFDVAIQVKPGRRYRMGDVRFLVTGNDRSGIIRDTLNWIETAQGTRLNVTVQRNREAQLNPILMAHLMQFSPGEWYNQSKLLQTKLLFEQSGLFPFTTIGPQYRDVQTENEVTYVPIVVDLRTRSRFQFNWDGALLQRFNTNTNDELGLGTGVSFSDNNIWGLGEKLQAKVSASGTLERGFIRQQEDEAQVAYKRSTQYDAALSLTFPYLRRGVNWIGPFFGVPYYNTRTRMTLNFLHENRDLIKLKRDRAALQYRVELRHNRAVTTSLDLFDFTYSNPDSSDGFTQQYLRYIKDPIQRKRAEEDYTVRKVNNAFRYVIRGANVDPLRRENGFSSEFSAELGGTLPFLVDRFLSTPEALEGTLPGVGGRSALSYRQYARFYLDFRRYKPLGTNTTLAWKTFAGWAFPMGSHLDIPLADRCGDARHSTREDCRGTDVAYERRFFIGGSSSVRAWNLGELGPGPLSADSNAGEIKGALGGDIKAEVSVEYRQIFARNIFGADYGLAIFTDMGNIWYDWRREEDSASTFALKNAYKQLGIGSGVGLRIAWPYFILRLDFAVQVYSPEGKIFPNGIRFRFVPGLGQAF